MTREEHLKLITNTDLTKADIIYNNYDIDNKSINLRAYYFEDLEDQREYIIALNNKGVAGIRILYNTDIQLDVLDEYQGRHIMSGFFKYANWKSNLGKNFKNEASIALEQIKSFDDLLMKIYLINDLMELRISNLEELFDKVKFSSVDYEENNEFKINKLLDLYNFEKEKNKELEEKRKNGTLSDGYHTYNDLYYQRCILFATICNLHKDISWKSKKHNDGKKCFDNNNWFIVGIDTPKGSYTYHYEMKYWNIFKVKELEKGKEWDGHTEKDVTRLLSLEK